MRIEAAKRLKLLSGLMSLSDQKRLMNRLSKQCPSLKVTSGIPSLSGPLRSSWNELKQAGWTKKTKTHVYREDGSYPLSYQEAFNKLLILPEDTDNISDVGKSKLELQWIGKELFGKSAVYWLKMGGTGLKTMGEAREKLPQLGFELINSPKTSDEIWQKDTIRVTLKSWGPKTSPNSSILIERIDS